MQNFSFDVGSGISNMLSFARLPGLGKKTKTLRCPREGLVTTKDNDDLQRLVGCCNVGLEDLFMMIFHGEKNTSKKLGRFCFGGSPSPEDFIHANWIKLGQKRSKKWEFMKLSKDMTAARKRIQMSTNLFFCRVRNWLICHQEGCLFNDSTNRHVGGHTPAIKLQLLKPPLGTLGFDVSCTKTKLGTM